MYYKKIIREWAKNRHYDQTGVVDAALSLYRTLDKREQEFMLREFKDYNEGVKSGRIIPSPVQLHVPTFKVDKVKVGKNFKIDEKFKLKK